MKNQKLRSIISLLLLLALLAGLVGCSAAEVKSAAKTAGEVLEIMSELSEKEETPSLEELEPEEPDAELPEELELDPESEEPSAELPEQKDEEPAQAEEEAPAIDEDGEYTKRDDVALYIHTYGHLPKNFITKNEARKLGWSGGGLDDYAPGKAIGGDKFGNYEGLLPTKEGRQYYECDIDTVGKSSRGAKRIIYSNDGLIYYTNDHYESFTLLYGEE